MKVSDNVAMLEITGGFAAVNLTLIWGDGHLVLVDTGIIGTLDEIIQAISAEGFRAEDLTEIILTHQDMDHIGNVLEFLKLAPKARVLLHADEAPYLDGTQIPVKLAAMIDNYENLSDEGKGICDFLKQGYANRRIHAAQTLADGEVLPYCGGIEAVHTPGHTPGHLCLYLRESKIMVGGDALNIADGNLIGSDPNYTHDIEQGQASLEKIKAFNLKGAVSSHCGYWAKGN